MSITPDPDEPLARPDRATTAAPAEGIPSIRSDLLLGQARQLRIEHAGEWYVLRQTTNNKLILTK
jgi:hemin uptake protein HemP